MVEVLFLDTNFANRFENKKLKARDVITTRTGANIGQTCLVPAKYAGSVRSQRWIVTVARKNQLLPEYLVQHMNAPESASREIGVTISTLWR